MNHLTVKNDWCMKASIARAALSAVRAAVAQMMALWPSLGWGAAQGGVCVCKSVVHCKYTNHNNPKKGGASTNRRTGVLSIFPPLSTNRQDKVD